MVAEIHTCLVYNLRQLPNQRNTASVSLYAQHQDMLRTGTTCGHDITIPDLIHALSDRGVGWERMPLRGSEDRECWVEAIVGFLKDVSSKLCSSPVFH
jgi:bromodomain adjacent to zinc finger domain protein 1A